jgi:hypothetical protein
MNGTDKDQSDFTIRNSLKIPRSIYFVFFYNIIIQRCNLSMMQKSRGVQGQPSKKIKVEGNYIHISKNCSGRSTESLQENGDVKRDSPQRKG